MGLGATLSTAAGVFRGQKIEMSFEGPVFYTETLPDGKKVDYRFASSEPKKPLQGPHHRMWLDLQRSDLPETLVLILKLLLYLPG